MNIKLAEYAGPGHWNDPDMLEVGNGNLTYEENKTHFSLWCMMAAPLILGNDIRKLPDEKRTLEILSNRDMIAINQDKLGKQCVRYKKTLSFDFLVKELENDRIAVCVYNKTNRVSGTTFKPEELPAGMCEKARKMKEIWTGKTIENCAKIELKPHDCMVFITL